MPQPRKYKTNAARQAAYRARKAAAEASVPNATLVGRVMAEDARSRYAERANPESAESTK